MPSPATYLLPWGPDGALRAWQTLGRGRAGRKVRNWCLGTSPPRSPPPPPLPHHPPPPLPLSTGPGSRPPPGCSPFGWPAAGAAQWGSGPGTTLKPALPAAQEPADSLTWAPGLPCCPGGPGSPWGPCRKQKQKLKGALEGERGDCTLSLGAWAPYSWPPNLQSVSCPMRAPRRLPTERLVARSPSAALEAARARPQARAPICSANAAQTTGRRQVTATGRKVQHRQKIPALLPRQLASALRPYAGGRGPGVLLMPPQ